MNKNIKFGIVAPLPGVSVLELIEFTVKAEKGGFYSIWFPDHILFMADKLTPEVWSIITAASVKTEVIRMGAIGDPHRFHPAIFAQRLATVDHISKGRIFTCLGYGEKMNLDCFGINWNKPLGRLKESVEIMRKLWLNDRVDYEGKFFKLKEATLKIAPLSEGNIPIFIAATGPNALKLAGEFGDGWVTNAMPTWVFNDKWKVVNGFLSENEQDLKEFDRCIYMFLSIAKTNDDAYSTIEGIKHAIIWPDVLKDAGYEIEIADEFKGLEYTKIMPNDSAMLEKFKEMGSRYYTREIVEDFIICGNVETVIKRIENYINAGVSHFIFRDFSPDKEYSFNLLTEEIIPEFTK